MKTKQLETPKRRGGGGVRRSPIRCGVRARQSIPEFRRAGGRMIRGDHAPPRRGVRLQPLHALLRALRSTPCPMSRQQPSTFS